MKKQYVVVFYVNSELPQTEAVEALQKWGDSIELPEINISDVHIDELYEPYVQATKKTAAG